METNWKVDYPTYSATYWTEDYEWSEVGVWVRPDGYYVSTDSGCSCYSPWESHSWNDPDAFTGPLTFEQVVECVYDLELDDDRRSEVGTMLLAIEDHEGKDD